MIAASDRREVNRPLPIFLTSALSASMSLYGVYSKPPGSGPKFSWYLGSVAVIAAKVRPWNELSAA